MHARSEPAIVPLFRIAWAASMLFHLASYPHLSAFDRNGSILALLALAVLIFPSRPAVFLCCCVVQVGHTIVYLPQVPNHWLFAALVNLAILGASATTFLQARRLSWQEADWRRFASPCRAMVLLLYFFAAFHKLNIDFLNPSVSCGMRLIREVSWLSIPHSPLVDWFCMVGSLLIEALIPVLLLWPRTAMAGILLGCLFHGLLGVLPQHGFFNFSSMIYAAYLAFLPIGIGERMLAVGGSWVNRLSRQATWWLRLAVVVLVVQLCISCSRNFTIGRFVWVVYATTFVALLVAARRSCRQIAPTRSFVFSVVWSMPVLVLLNGLCPYLGLKTETSWAMFSNLRTEGSFWNHLIVPKSMQVFSLQDDLVIIVQSDDPQIEKLRATDYALVWFEFRRHVASHPQFTTHFRRGNDDVQSTDDLRWSRPGVIPRKLLWFRPVDMQPNVRCRH